MGLSAGLVVVPVANELVYAAAVEEAGLGAHVVDEVMEEGEVGGEGGVVYVDRPGTGLGSGGVCHGGSPQGRC